MVTVDGILILNAIWESDDGACLETATGAKIHNEHSSLPMHVSFKG